MNASLEIIYQRDSDTLSESEAVKHLTEDDGTAFLRLLAPVGEQYGKPVCLAVYITAEPGQPCRIFCTSGKLTADEAEAMAILLVTARLIAQAADRERMKVRTP